MCRYEENQIFKRHPNKYYKLTFFFFSAQYNYFFKLNKFGFFKNSLVQEQEVIIE